MEENKLVAKNEITNEEIKKLIYTIRGKQVMLDSDVAMLYQYTTKNINKAVKRNIDRFPEDFCFQLTESEFQELRFRFGTLIRKLIMETLQENAYLMFLQNKEFQCFLEF